MAQSSDQSTQRNRVIQVRVDDQFKTNLRVAAARSGKSMSEYIRDSLRSTWEVDA